VVIQDEDELDILYETLLYFLTDHSPMAMKVTVECDSNGSRDSNDTHEEPSPTTTKDGDENTQKSQPHEPFHLEIKDEVDLGVFNETVLNYMTEHSPMAMKITVEFDSTESCDSKDSDDNSEE